MAAADGAGVIVLSGGAGGNGSAALAGQVGGPGRQPRQSGNGGTTSKNGTGIACQKTTNVTRPGPSHVRPPCAFPKLTPPRSRTLADETTFLGWWREKLRSLLADAVEAAGSTRGGCRSREAIGEELLHGGNAVDKWVKRTSDRVPMGDRLLRMLVDPRALGELGRRELLTAVCRLGGATCVFDDEVVDKLDGDRAQRQVCEIAAPLGELSGEVLAAGSEIDPGEAERMLPAARKVAAEAMELEQSLERIAGETAGE